MVQVGLRTLCNAHLDVDRVVVDIDLDGLDVREHVTIVIIIVTSGIIVFFQALVHLLLVIDVASLHAKHGIQIVGGHDGVTHPCDVADVVFVAFIDFHIDIDVLLVVSRNRVFKDRRIAETQLVVLFDKSLLGFLVTLVGKLLRLEDIG